MMPIWIPAKCAIIGGPDCRRDVGNPVQLLIVERIVANHKVKSSAKKGAP